MNILCLIELETIVDGFRVLQDLPNKFEVELVDSSYLQNGQFRILFRISEESKNDLGHYLQSVKSVKDWTVVHSHLEPILQAYFSQLRNSITQENLLIFEGRSLSSSLKLAYFLLSQTTFKLLELKSKLSGDFQSLLLAQGPSSEIDLVKDHIRRDIGQISCRFEMLSKPNELIKQLYSNDYGRA